MQALKRNIGTANKPVWKTIGHMDGTDIKFLPPMCKAHRPGDDTLGCRDCEKLNNPFGFTADAFKKLGKTMIGVSQSFAGLRDAVDKAYEADKRAVQIKNIQFYNHPSTDISKITGV